MKTVELTELQAEKVRACILFHATKAEMELTNLELAGSKDIDRMQQLKELSDYYRTLASKF